jgi:hypothetical protein
VNLSHYSIRSPSMQVKLTFSVQSCLIECSADGVGWTEVDRYDENRSLDFRHQIQYCDVRDGAGESRFVRLRQTRISITIQIIASWFLDSNHFAPFLGNTDPCALHCSFCVTYFPHSLCVLFLHPPVESPRMQFCFRGQISAC